MAGKLKTKLQGRNLKSYKLCYVENNFAYFTTADLTKQTGDDWDDVPYEHNAGTPYEMEGEKLIKLAFTNVFDTPEEGYFNSPFSVDMINKGAIAWLRTSQYNEKQVVIPAGTSIPKFIELVEQVGDVFIPYKWL